MRVLSYSPSVEAYAMVGRDRTAVDLTPDIVSCQVSRKSDAASTFSLTLQNKNWKYNGVFSCFDPITIYCTKSDRMKLFTGYINDFDSFSLYQGDFEVSGLCTIYRLQKLYWDPLLLESQILVHDNAYLNGKADNGYAERAVKLLTKVANWPSDGIHIGDMPSDAIEFAKSMYAAGAESAGQVKSMADEFYEVLKTHGSKFSASSVPSAGGGDAVNYTADDAKMTDDQKRIVETALSGGIGGMHERCLEWVQDVCDAAGFPFQRLDGAIDVWSVYGNTGSMDVDSAPPGAMMVGSGWGDMGALYGHIGIKVTGGRIISMESTLKIRENADDFYSWQNATCRGFTGAVGWVPVPGASYARK